MGSFHFDATKAYKDLEIYRNYIHRCLSMILLHMTFIQAEKVFRTAPLFKRVYPVFHTPPYNDPGLH